MGRAVEVARSSHGSVVLSQRIVQLHSGPLAGSELGVAQEAECSGLAALGARHDDPIAQAKVSDRLDAHDRARRWGGTNCQ